MGHPLPKIDPARLLAQTDWVRDLAQSLVDPVHAEDVSQEAILIALRHPPRAYEDEPRLRAWLRRVVVNLVRFEARTASRRRTREERVARPERLPSAADTVERASQVRMVVEAVTDLEEPYRAAVLLRYFDQRSSVEIAKMIDESPAAVRKRVSRGLDKLRARLEAEHGSEHRGWLLGLAGLSRGPDARGSPVWETPVLTHKAGVAIGAAILVVLPLVVFLSRLEERSVGVSFDGVAGGETGRAPAELLGLARTETVRERVALDSTERFPSTSSLTGRQTTGYAGALYTFDGDSEGDRLGKAVDGAGDVNGDGHEDVIAAAPGDDDNGENSGSVRVYSGKDGSPLFTFHGDSAGDELGSRWRGGVGGAGDVNGDEYDDIIAGAWRADHNGVVCGMARVFLGPDGTRQETLYGKSAGDEFGFSVSGAGDVDKDGYADLIIGAPGEDASGENSGAVYVYSGFDFTPIWSWSGASEGDGFGSSVNDAGDVDLDGYADVIVGAPYADFGGMAQGSATVFSGKTGKVIRHWYCIAVGQRWSLFGDSVNGAGDVNGDGYADLIVGAPGHDLGNGERVGMARVYSGMNGKPLHEWYGEVGEGANDTFTKGDQLGWSVSGAGDVDGDGRDDLIVGAQVDDSDDGAINAGSATIYSGWTGQPLAKFEGDDDGESIVLNVGRGTSLGLGDRLGASVGSADVNGDGIPDLIIGVEADDNNGADSGRVLVIAGWGPLGTSYCSPAVANSSGLPGLLRAWGLDDVTENQLRLTAEQIPASEVGYFLTGRIRSFFVPPGSDGYFCLGGELGRFASSGRGPSFSMQVDLESMPVRSGAAAQPGETWNFQAWYRDGNTNNFTDAISVTFH